MLLLQEFIHLIYINQWSSVGFISWVWLKNIQIIFAISTWIHSFDRSFGHFTKVSIDIHLYAKYGNRIWIEREKFVFVHKQKQGWIILNSSFIKYTLACGWSSYYSTKSSLLVVSCYNSSHKKTKHYDENWRRAWQVHTCTPTIGRFYQCWKFSQYWLIYTLTRSKKTRYYL